MQYFTAQRQIPLLGSHVYRYLGCIYYVRNNISYTVPLRKQVRSQRRINVQVNQNSFMTWLLIKMSEI
jgi:hypothetical protein